MPYLPALILAIVLTAYWGRVLRLVYKIRKTGHGAGYAPHEPLGKLLRLIWQPATVIWIVQPCLTAVHARVPLFFRPIGALFSPLAGWLACLVAAAAFAATCACWKKMGKSWRMGINPEEKTQLIVTGPYAYIRHPIYALSSALMLASIVIVPSPTMLIVGALHLALLQWEARREEQHLTVHHGSAYVEYCRAVPRFLPFHLRAYDPALARRDGVTG